MARGRHNRGLLWRHPQVVAAMIVGLLGILAVVIAAILTDFYGLGGGREPIPAPVVAKSLGSIQGATRDRGTRDPVANVLIKVWPAGEVGGLLQDESRSTGAFFVGNVEIGRQYDFLATHPEYKDYDDLVTPTGERPVPGDLYLIRNKEEAAVRMENLRPGPVLADKATLSFYEPLRIKISIDETPKLTDLVTAEVKREILVSEFTIKNEGEVPVYLDLRKTFFNGQFSPSQPSVPSLGWDYWASALVQEEALGPVLKLDAGQEVQATLAFTPLQGQRVPKDLTNIFPSFWGISVGATEGFAVFPSVNPFSQE